MSTPAVFLAYAPRGAGLLCAVVYHVIGNHVAGWWTGSAQGEIRSAYFLAEDFFGSGNRTLLASRGNDLYGGWHFDFSRSEPALADPIPCEDGICHELERLQFQFAREWLVFSEEPEAAAEEASYANAELATGTVLIRHRLLNKLAKDGAVWIYGSPTLDLNVIHFLAGRWPLDYRSD